MNGNGKGEFLRNAALLTGIVVGVVTVLVPLYVRDSPISSEVQKNTANTDSAKSVADSAQVTANSALSLAVRSTLNKEKVCSEHHQGTPCRNLFNRLSRALSNHQRRELACAVLVQLAQNKALMLRRGRCPR